MDIIALSFSSTFRFLSIEKQIQLYIITGDHDDK